MECALVTAVITEVWIAGFHHYDGEIDLYHRLNDPMCQYNLASDERYSDTIEQLRRRLSPNTEIPDDPLKWRECLGPEETITNFRANYVKQYKRLLSLDEENVPGRVGGSVEAFPTEIGAD